MHDATVAQDTKHCGLAICPGASRVYVLFIYFVFSACEQCTTDFSPRKRQNSAQLQGLSRFFHLFVHSVRTKQGTLHDKIAHRTRGQGRPFPSGIFVILGGVRGLSVIRPLFYYFNALTAGACTAHASEVPRLRAPVAARASSSRRQKLTSAVPEDAPEGALSSGAARSIHLCPVKPRRTVFSPTSLFSLLPPPTSYMVPDVGVNCRLVPEVLISFL